MGDEQSLFAFPPALSVLNLSAASAKPHPACSGALAAHALPAAAPHAAHPRLSFLVPGTSLLAPPHGGLAGVNATAFVPYELFPQPQPLSAEGVGAGGGAPHFIASATELKKLLSIPYCDSPFSLAVQRVGNTLLVEGDERLRGSLGALLAGGGGAGVGTPPAASSSQRLLEARFLFHSLSCEASLRALEAPAEASQRAPEPPFSPRGELPEAELEGGGALQLATAFSAGLRRRRVHRGRRRRPQTSAEEEEEEADATLASGAAPLPPSSEDSCSALWSSCGGADSTGFDSAAPPSTPDPSSERRWAPPRSPSGTAPGSFDLQPRLFSWTLGDMRCVVESSLLLFRSAAGAAGEGHSVALKLLSVDERVTPQKCLSAWLDNVIAGVPELAVCYHKGGVVQGYQTVATQGIPQLCDPPFEPDQVLAAGHAVLSFLRSQCTREDAVYWLHRDAQSQLLRLYDVSSLLQAQAAARAAAPKPEKAEGGAEANEAPSSGAALLCLRLEQQLAAGSAAAEAEEEETLTLLRDRWRLLHRAEALAGGSGRLLGKVLRAQADACLSAQAVGMWEAVGAMEGGEGSAGQSSQPPPLPQPLPPLAWQPPPRHRRASDASYAELALAWLSDAAQLPDACLQAAWARLSRARLLLGGRAEAGAEASEAAIAAALARRRYGAGRAAAAAQWARRSAAAQPAPSLQSLSLLADAHAAQRGGDGGVDSEVEEEESGGEEEVLLASLAAARAPPGAQAAAAHWEASRFCYTAALAAMEATKSSWQQPQSPQPPASALARAAAAWHAGAAAAFAAGGAPLERALRRRLASLLNERGQRESGPDAAGDVTRLRSAAEAFREAASLFSRAADPLNHALASRNAAHTLRRAGMLDGASAGEEGVALCRAAAKALRRREVEGLPGSDEVLCIVQLELGQQLLAHGLLCSAAGGRSPEAAELVAEAARVFGALGGRAARERAVAEYHLGELHARRSGAEAGRLACRHFRKALDFFAAEWFPLDNVRIRLRLAGLEPAGAVPMLRGCVEAVRRLEGAKGEEAAAAEELCVRTGEAWMKALCEAARGGGAAEREAYEGALWGEAAGAPVSQLLDA